MIDPLTKNWNNVLLNQYLDPIDIVRIHKVPISPTQSQNKLVWLLAKNGELSAKSAYWFDFQLVELSQDKAICSINNKIILESSLAFCCSS